MDPHYEGLCSARVVQGCGPTPGPMLSCPLEAAALECTCCLRSGCVVSWHNSNLRPVSAALPLLWEMIVHANDIRDPSSLSGGGGSVSSEIGIHNFWHDKTRAISQR